MIEFRDVVFRYDAFAPAPVLSGLDLSLREGEWTALLGRNGSGKSTIARLSNGLLLPERGAVLVNGLDTRVRADLPRIRRRVQLVFQNPENQQVGTTVYEDIAFGLANRGVPTEQMPGLAAAALDRAGIALDLGRKLAHCSGGELQRIALAGVLALDPEYLVLDEATSMLDRAARDRLLGSIQALHDRDGIGIIQITHHLDEVATADRIVVLVAGRIEADGTVDEVFSDAALLSRAGLEAPQVRNLLAIAHASARRRGQSVPERDAATAEESAASAAATSAAPATQDHPAAIVLEAASYSYDKARRQGRGGPLALQPTTLSIRPGEVVAIAGPSGAGKTTLLNLIKGIRPPRSGSVFIDGEPLWRGRRRSREGRIGYVLQHPEHQLFASTVAADVGYALRGSGISPEEVVRRVAAQLSAFGFVPEQIEQESPFALSGGQQRRVALAGVLVADPAAILLDEPTAGLDAPARRELFAELERFRADGRAVVFVSHRLEEIAEYATRVIVVSQGSVILDSSPSALFADRDALARLGWPTGEDAPSRPGMRWAAG